MTPLNDGESSEPTIPPGGDSADLGATRAFDSAQQQAIEPSPFATDPAATAPAPTAYAYAPPSSPPLNSPAPNSPSSNIDQPLFSSYAQPPVRRPVRIPHFGHLLLLSLLIFVALGIMALVLGLASYFHLFGFQSSAISATNVGFDLSSEVFLYFVTFGFALFVFPMIWNEGYFQGLQWRGEVARSRFGLLAGIASACFGLALLDQFLMPGPSTAPIDKMISSPGAAWLMFAFGVTLAPFFEEMFFRGFLLPSLSTACDWIVEVTKHAPPHPLNAGGHPQWSLPSMIIGSVLTSIPFALIHAEQQGHSLGPFLLMIAISMILCAVRLRTRSLAASTLVHASYNFLLFSVELIVTGGFRHFDKM
jgi:hypothetical protein